MDKARIHETLRRLRAEFPLQARIEIAPEQAQEVYAEILGAWVTEGRAPQENRFPPDIVQYLVGLDAIAKSSQGLACYPFSIKNTGIEVRWGHSTVAAMCAIDALAIPALARSPTTIHAACAHCGQAVEASVGELPPRAITALPDRCFVYYGTPVNLSGKGCCDGLCTGIVFLCASCADPTALPVLAMDEAVAVAEDFFAFQMNLLTIHT
ncbi:hypothetical protein JKG47_14705 [Acidithiobacillus sp. MC6.1]|nr:hypothetical protein [Acidithiobacillus sp. MC6.1]